jgi:protease-4
VLVESLDRAATDSKVTSVVLRVSFLPDVGWGRVQELRDAILRFRKSGKPAYAHLEFCGNKEYYLASACTQDLRGPHRDHGRDRAAQRDDVLQEHARQARRPGPVRGRREVQERPEPVHGDGVHAPHREQMDALLDSLYGNYVAGLQQGRNKTAEQVQAMIDNGPYDGQQALKAGLVDELVYDDQLRDRSRTARRSRPANTRVRAAVSASTSAEGRARLRRRRHHPGESQGGPFGGQFRGLGYGGGRAAPGAQGLGHQGHRAPRGQPGGSGTASDVIWREVVLAKKVKPVVVSMGDLGASGGYYIAMAADAIVAQPTTITGSIGVFGGKFSLHGSTTRSG